MKLILTLLLGLVVLGGCYLAVYYQPPEEAHPKQNHQQVQPDSARDKPQEEEHLPFPKDNSGSFKEFLVQVIVSALTYLVARNIRRAIGTTLLNHNGNLSKQ